MESTKFICNFLLILCFLILKEYFKLGTVDKLKN